jgi:flagellar basal-body rod modification protein FlgD
MAIETIDVSKYQANSKTQSRTPSAELGKDDFLKLLVTQLQNQDPMNPMEDMDFIGQMAQFSSLEQMLNLTKQVETITTAINANAATQAMLYLGTTVTAQHPDSSEPITGMVEMVGFENGVPYLKIGDKPFALEDVQLVSPTYLITEE